MDRVIVVGAGVGGLAAAAELARAGLDVTVLEAHVYPGGCAGTFYHQGYRFDAGATLAGGFADGAPMDLLARHFGIDWEGKSTERAMQVHLPDGATVTRWTDHERWQAERRRWFGEAAEPFWHWQEQTADVLWNLALRLPAWPPQTPRELATLFQTGVSWLGDHLANGHTQTLPRVAGDAFRSVATHLQRPTDRLRLFVDAQLLIAAQTTSRHANALYGAASLDLPRQGVAHVPGGIGAIAEKLVHAVERYGGRVLFRQEVTRVVSERGRPISVETNRGKGFDADQVIFNLPPWNVAPLLGDAAPAKLCQLPPKPHDGWGAFVIYACFDGSIVPEDFPLHHQVVVREPLAEGNTLFLSLSPAWDEERAPAGHRALTISTHTHLEPWWHFHQHDRPAYEQRKDEYNERVLKSAERVLPGLREAADLVLPGTPVTFQRFTRRAWGWVGGFPQTSLFRAWGPRLVPNLWLVGDTLFPGQSVPAVALGGLRVAGAVLNEMPAFEQTKMPLRVRAGVSGTG